MITKEYVLQAKKDTTQIFDDLLANFEADHPVLISAEMVDGNILVKFKADRDIDLHYWYDDKVHQVLQYIKDIDEEQGKFLIGISKPDKTWKVQLISEDYASPVMEVKHEEQEPIPNPEKPVDKQTLWTAFWSSQNVPESDLKQRMSAGLTDSPNYEDCRAVIDSGRNVIPLFAGFEKDHTEQQLRQRVGWYTSVFERIGWENIEAIILRDEPYLKGLSIKQMDIIIDEARKQYKAPLAMTFTQGTIQKRVLPAGLDIVIINFYPYFTKTAPEGYAQIHDYPSFKAHFDADIERTRHKAPSAKIAITAQVFGAEEDGRIPWRSPEPETAEWYMKAIADHSDIVGLTFWGWTAKNYIGFEDLPDLQQAWTAALEKYNQ